MRPRFTVIPCFLLACTAFAQSANYLVVDEGNFTQYWKATERDERIRLPKSTVHRHAEGCVAVGFSIEADGRTANLTVLRSGFTERASKQTIAEVEKSVLRNFAETRFAATPTNPEHKPVYTYATYSFSSYEMPSTDAEVEKRSAFVRATCEIADFPGVVARGELVKKAAS